MNMETKDTIKIALADDHAMMRKGLAEIMSKFEDVTVILEAGDGGELIEKMKKAKVLPDICILDINMKGMNGYETAAVIKETWPDIRMIALSMYDNESNIIKMLRNGANGYILKDNEPEELQKAIQHVYEHGFYHSELVTGRMLKLMQDPSSKTIPELTEREQQFLSLCCTEMTYKEIANEMHLSPRTIDGYREDLFLKLNIKSRTGLILYAVRLGIIPAH